MEKQQFRAESKRLLDLMINSIYTHKEIFLREIISNASDAVDKLAYQALTDEKVGLNRDDFVITIQREPKYGILTVSDNGIGMSKEEMEENLGTICKSGSLDFKEQMDKQEDVDIIGQFGVGFYSAFMVAETVTVISRRYGSEEAWMWQSSGADGYTITPAQRDTAGTDVIMKLKADTEDEKYSRFLEEFELRELVNDLMHSPIRVPVMFAAFYGMRRSEALGIRKAVIDRKKKTITVCHTVIEVSVQGEHKIIRKDRTKNKKSFRTYPLIPQVEAFLDWELQQQEQQHGKEIAEYMQANNMYC